MHIRRERFELGVFWLVCIDVLFLPYIGSLGVNLSIIVMSFYLLYYFFSGRYKFGSLEKKITFMIFLLLISLLKGTLLYSDGVVIDDKNTDYLSVSLINTILLALMFVYFLFFCKLSSSHKINIEDVLFKYLFFNFFLCVYYFYDPLGFFSIRSFWTLSGQTIDYAELNESVRFLGIFSDPNNMSVAIVSILSFILFNVESFSKSKKLVSIFLSFVIVVATMSSTGIISFSLIMIFWLVSILSKRKIKLVNVIVFVVLFLFFLLSIFFFLEYLSSTRLGEIIFNRASNNNGSLDHRLHVYKDVIYNANIFSSLIFGDGAVFIDGVFRRPHNGHLYLIYGYGLVLYSAFMLTFFRFRIKLSFFKQVYLIPIFLGFTLNVGVYDLRFFTIMVMLVSFYTYSKASYR